MKSHIKGLNNLRGKMIADFLCVNFSFYKDLMFCQKCVFVCYYFGIVWHDLLETFFILCGLARKFHGKQNVFPEMGFLSLPFLYTQTSTYEFPRTHQVLFGWT